MRPNRLWLIVGAAMVLGLTGCTEADTPATKQAESAPTTAPAGGYALATCIVSGEKLGSMGDPVIYSHEGREVRFCCASCEAEFKNNPAQFLAKLDAAKSGAQPSTQPAPQVH